MKKAASRKGSESETTKRKAPVRRTPEPALPGRKTSTIETREPGAPGPGSRKTGTPKKKTPECKTLKPAKPDRKASMPKTGKPVFPEPERQSSRMEIKELQEKVRELEETLDAIRSGEVDAIVVAKGDDRQVYTLEGADQPYRVLVENIREGVLTLAEDGAILYGNNQFGAMLHTPCRKILGSSFADHVCEEDRPVVAGLLRNALAGPVKQQLILCHDGSFLPVQVTLNTLVTGGHTRISAIITNRKEDEDRIRMHARMLDATGDAVIAANTEGKIIYWNDAATNTYGWKQKEAMGRNLISLLVPEPSQQEVRKIAVRLLKGEKWTGRYVVRHRDGHTFTIHATDAPLFDENGDLTAVISASHDIMDRVEAEERLRRANEQTAMVLESISDSFLALDQDWRFTYVNNRAVLPANVIPSEIIGKSVWEVFPEITGTTLEAFYREAMARKEPMMFENRSVVAGGRTFELHTYPTSDNGLAIFGHDITDRKVMEETLRKSEEEYRHVVENAPASIYEISPDGLRFNRVNDVMCRTLGYSREELMAMNPFSILDEESRKRFWERVEKRSAGGEIDESVAYRVLTKDGRLLWVTLNIKLNHDRGESTLVVAHDVTERKKAEEALRESEERFRSLAENAPSILQRFDRQLRIVYLSPLAAKITGLPSEAFIGKTNREMGMPEDLCRLWENVQNEVFETGENRDVEFAIATPGGRRTFFLRFAPEMAPDGSITHILGISTDITDRKEAEEALHDAHQRTATILEGIADTFYSLDREWRFTTVNPAAEKAPFARPAAELLGKVIWDLYPALVGTEVHRHYLAAAGKHTMEHYEALSPINSRWYEVFMQGRESGVDVYMRDISDRKKVEEALRETTQHLDNLINYANAPIIVWDPQFRITRFNHAFEQLTGMAAENVIGQHLAILFPKEFREAAMDVIHRTMGGERLNVVELPILRKDGDVRVVLWNSATLYEQDGTTVSSTIAQGNDITERKLAEEELRRRHADLSAAYEEISATQEELHQNVEELSLREQELLRSEAKLKDALTEKEILLSEIHHRVKNNLAAFISLLSLDGTYEDTEAGQALRKDLQNRARSMALIHETLYRTGKFSNVDMEIYLTTLIDQVAATFRGKTGVDTVVFARGVVLDLSRATTAGLIINELVTNSFKYAFQPPFNCAVVRGERCTIRITLSEEDGIFIILVADNGCGLPADLDPLAAKSLGLRLVNFLARHQLRAEIAVRENKGTEFIFRFSKTEDHP